MLRRIEAKAHSLVYLKGLILGEGRPPKSGPESCRVARQWCGRLGKKENCHVGVYLLGVTLAGTALLDHGLYLPEAWAADRARRRKTRVPEEVKFQTKPQIATEQIRRTRAAGHVRFDWITADELYGRDGDFLDALEGDANAMLLRYPSIRVCGSSTPRRRCARGAAMDDRRRIPAGTASAA